MTPQQAYEKQYAAIDGGRHTWEAAPPHVKVLWLDAWTMAANAERESCAKLLLETDLGGLSSDRWLQKYTAKMLFMYAAAIQARGQA